jgi:hemerythrin
MNSSETWNRAFRDHEALRQSAWDLRHLLLTAASDRRPDGAIRRVHEALDAFRRHVNRHFELEEAGWSHSRSSDWAGRARIEASMLEHESMRARLATVMASVQQDSDASIARDLATEIHAILDDLLRHELSETGLFQSQLLRGLEDSSSAAPHSRGTERE